jgi:anti-sigma B factor antagonist
MMCTGMSNAISHKTRLIEARELTIASEREGAGHLLALSGDLDMATVRPFEDELHRVEAGDAEAIVVDLGALDFLDSHGVTALANAQRRASRADHDFKVLRGAPHIHASFELLGLDERLPFD